MGSGVIRDERTLERVAGAGRRGEVQGERAVCHIWRGNSLSSGDWRDWMLMVEMC